ncbi:MAG: peptide chain release factor N(5)-glutamine methyltransferase [Deltaproteobacteria bacterium]|nr:peptide chain release factor N(5)-glutamine methyltransferase [Deltaproteobacteria bacterium]
MSKQVPSGGHSEPWTVLRLIQWTTSYLTGKGVKRARFDAEVLLADLLELSRVKLYLNYDRPLNQPELKAFRERVRRRADFEPVAYITGHKEFYSLELKVDRGVLIPRPETELLVDETLKAAQNQLSDHEAEIGSLHIVDLGTGCGAIALALASRLSQARIWAIDLSEKAVEIARANAKRHGLESRITFLQGDLLEPLRDRTDYFHLIAANLPYVPRIAFDDMAPDVKDFEPRLALNGGEDGLDLITKAVAQARALLRLQGALLLEIWHTHAPAVREMGRTCGYNQVRICKDLAGRDRVAVLIKNNPGGSVSHG